MLPAVRPSTVLLVVAEVVNTDAQKEREAEPNQGTPRTVKVFGVPDACFKPSSDLVERPHRTHEHGTGVPALSHHAGDDERNHTGQEGTPIADVAVIAHFGGDAQLVNDADGVEVVE